MKLLLKIFLISVLVLTAVTTCVYISLPFLVNSSEVEEKIVKNIEHGTEGVMSFHHSDLRYFPFLGITFYDVELNSNLFNKNVLKSKKVALRFDLFDMLRGKLGISKMQVDDANLVLGSQSEWIDDVEISNVNLTISRISSRIAMEVKFEGDFEGMRDSLSGEIKFEIPSMEDWSWQGMTLTGHLDLKQLELNVLQKNILPKLPIKITEGGASSSLQIQKYADEVKVKLMGQVEMNSFVYQYGSNDSVLVSPALNLEFDYDAFYDVTIEELYIQRSQIKSPMGSGEASGAVFLGTGEIQDFRFALTDFLLEGVPQYWIPIRELIPINFGFSGAGNIDVSLQGALDHLAINANVDLTPSNLTYARYFSKPKNVPLTSTVDLLLEDGEVLSGDFSIKFRDATAKGNLKDYNFKVGKGQMNLLTNKFELSSWDQYILPLQNYDLKGGVKIFTNWEGNLFDFSELDKVFNLTFEDATIGRKGGRAINDLSLAIDFGEMSIDATKANFTISDSPVEMIFSVFNLSENPILEGTMKSENFSPVDIVETIKDLSLDWIGDKPKNFLEEMIQVLSQIFPKDIRTESISTDFKFRDNAWEIPNLKMSAYGGKLSLKGSINTSGLRPSYEASIDVNKWQLGKYLIRDGYDKGIAAGNLFLNMKLHEEVNEGGKWFDQVQGQGEFLITDGVLYNFDLLSEIGQISEFQNFLAFASGSTSFSDLRAAFTIQNGKIETDNLVVISPEVLIEAKGEITFEEILNYRMDVYLSENLTYELMMTYLENMGSVEGKQFGPIPFLLSGKAENPEIQTDPEQFPLLISYLEKRNTNKILHHFLGEDLRFERAALT